MIRKTISRSTFQEHLIALIQDEIAIEAIKDDGIYSTFKFTKHWLEAPGITKVNLHYCKLDCDDKWLPAQRKILYKNCPELGDVRFPYISAETMKNVTDRIKIYMVKKDNAIWSTIKFEPWTDHFTVSYDKAYVDKPMTAQEMEIENTKKTLQRLERMAKLTTYPFDEKLKEDIKASLEGKWKPKATPWCGFSPVNAINNEVVEYINRYSKSKEEKEKKDMNVTLMIVPEGMNKDFVKRVKANFQSNNSQRLFVSSVDIDYSCKYEPLKNKYHLFEYWIKTGMVDIVYFMLGFEKDPDVRAFEAFVRGVTETEVPGKIDVRVVYQKDDIENDIQHLRTAYFDEADAKEDLERAGNRVVREAKVLTEVYSLDNSGLDIIKYSKGKIDASDELVINDIMDMAFASDEDTKPAKKGGKK